MTDHITDRLTDEDVPTVGASVEHGADTNLDRLNLEQALRDFEVANRRVVDLAHRVSSLNRELLDTRAELAQAKIELGETRRYVDRIRGSRLFPLVRAMAQAARTLRR